MTTSCDATNAQERRQAVKRTRKAEKCMRRKAAKGAKNPSGTGEIVTESWETPVYLGDHPLQIEELKARAIWEAMGKKDVPDDAIIREAVMQAIDDFTPIFVGKTSEKAIEQVTKVLQDITDKKYASDDAYVGAAIYDMIWTIRCEKELEAEREKRLVLGLPTIEELERIFSH